MQKARETYQKKREERRLLREYKPYSLVPGENAFGMSYYGTHRRSAGGIKVDTRTGTMYYQGNAAGLWHTLITEMNVEEMLELVDALVLATQDMIERG